ncbi:MAG: hypothetical protein M3426_16170 [Actinomycetota bacterium]|nr:hypothetical protein [Actinomycetota bacterium]
MRVTPDPNVEEVAAIMAALSLAHESREEPEEVAQLRRSRWRLAGLLGHHPPRWMKLEGSLWSYSSWEGMV